MRESNVVLTAIAQADGQRKNRPALLLREMPKYGDFLVCGISTQLQQFIPNFDEVIRSDDVDFVESGTAASVFGEIEFFSRGATARNSGGAWLY